MQLVIERDGKHHAFKRSISTSGAGEYRIDGRAIRAEAYFTRLKALGIHTKAHLGFLVFQGDFARPAQRGVPPCEALCSALPSPRPRRPRPPRRSPLAASPPHPPAPSLPAHS